MHIDTNQVEGYITSRLSISYFDIKNIVKRNFVSDLIKCKG